LRVWKNDTPSIVYHVTQHTIVYGINRDENKITAW